MNMKVFSKKVFPQFSVTFKTRNLYAFAAKFKSKVSCQILFRQISKYELKAYIHSKRTLRGQFLGESLFSSGGEEGGYWRERLRFKICLGLTMERARKKEKNAVVLYIIINQ